ncbi:MAG: beta-ketoacyl synthase N-terminal-like domain-containing protein [Verrucomicrobiota bacterium]
MPWGGIVKMSAVRTFIPITWISEYRIDTENCQLYFKHLKSAFNATRGMVVVWHFTETPEGVRVEITHDLELHWPLIGGFVSTYIVGLLHSSHRHTNPGRSQAPSGKSAFIMSSRVVITGIGALTCIGHGRKGLWEGILAEKSGISFIERFDTAPYDSKCAGVINDFDPKEHFPPHKLKRIDRYAQFALVLTQQALDDSGLKLSPEEPRTDVGVSFGTALGGITTAELTHERFLRDGTRAIPPRSRCRSSAARPTATFPSRTAYAATARRIRIAAPPARWPSARPSASSARAARRS